MRDHRMERFVVLPFSVGCISESSVAVALQNPRRSKHATRTRREKEDEESLSNESMKHDVSNGFHKVFKTFKTFSQLFVYKEEMDDSDEDMEIGVPTDVKHVAHVGLDESESSSPSMSSWDNLFSPQHLFTLPSDHARECDLPMESLVQAST